MLLVGYKIFKFGGFQYFKTKKSRTHPCLKTKDPHLREKLTNASEAFIWHFINATLFSNIIPAWSKVLIFYIRSGILTTDRRTSKHFSFVTWISLLDFCTKILHPLQKFAPEILPSNQPLCFLLFRVHFNQKLFQILNLKLLANIFENHSLRKHEGECWELTESRSFPRSYSPATCAGNLSFGIFTTRVSKPCPHNKVLSRWFSTGVILLLPTWLQKFSNVQRHFWLAQPQVRWGVLLAFSEVGSKWPETLSILCCKGQPPTKNGPALELAGAEAEKPCSLERTFPLSPVLPPGPNPPKITINRLGIRGWSGGWLCAHSAGGLGWGTSSHMLQWRLKTQHDATKTQCTQINK